jgi:hypothetical protein
LLLAATTAATDDRDAAAHIQAWCRRSRYEDVRIERLLGGLQ